MKDILTHVMGINLTFVFRAINTRVSLKKTQRTTVTPVITSYSITLPAIQPRMKGQHVVCIDFK